jgi:hypothetical protein
MMSSQMATSISDLTYDLSLRSLSQQESALNELRSRTGVLLAATAIAIALLGGRALDEGDRSGLELAGTAFAIISFLLSVFVLAPKRDFAFVVDAATAHETFVERDVGLDDAHEALVYWNREVWEENQSVIDRLMAAFRWACVTLVAAVGLWSAALTVQ